MLSAPYMLECIAFFRKAFALNPIANKNCHILIAVIVEKKQRIQ